MDYSEIRDLIIKEIQTDKQLLTSFLAINRMIEDKTATYTALAEFSKVLGDRVGQNIIKNIIEDIPEGELTEFAEKCLAPIYKDMETTMLMLCNNVQFMQNAKAKIGLAPVNVQLDESRINNAVRRFAEAVDFASVKFLANSNTAKSIARNVVNESIKQNSEFQEKAGLNVLISRNENGKCCDWCKKVSGTFTSFEDLPVGFWAIHKGCSCTIDYKVGKTKSRLKFSTNENGKLEKYVEDIKNEEVEKLLDNEEKSGKIYVEKLVDTYIKDPLLLGETTPESKYKDLIKNGVDVLPLNAGSLKGIPYLKGGGFKANGIKDGKYFQYHPATRSHHDNEYYKLCSGQSGANRYDMNGNPIKIR